MLCNKDQKPKFEFVKYKLMNRKGKILVEIQKKGMV